MTIKCACGNNKCDLSLEVSDKMVMISNAEKTLGIYTDANSLVKLIAALKYQLIQLTNISEERW